MWIDKKLNIRTFKDKGNQFIGGRNWAKATRTSLRRIGNSFSAAGTVIDVALLYKDIERGQLSQELVIHSLDIIMDFAGFIPTFGPIIGLSYALLRNSIIDYIIIPTYEEFTR